MIFIKKQSNNNKNDFWIGFSDLMTGLMLVFIVLSLTFMAISKQKINDVETLLKESETNRIKMMELIKKLEETTKNLEKRKQNIILILSEKLATNNIKFDYDAEKGTVTIAQDILFESGKSDLNKEGEEFIKLFAKILNKNIFSSDLYKDLIKYIHIEGYASNDGSEEHNFDLSFERAKNVWLFMTNDELSLDEINSKDYINTNDLIFIVNNEILMKQKLNIVSRGEIDANQIFIDEKDRKVVFRFEFYDAYSELFKGLSK